MRFDGFREMIAYRARRAPDAPAFLTGGADGPCAISYTAFLADVTERAGSLRRSGKTCLGVLCDGSYECLTAIFAAVEAGMQVVLLNENATPEQIALTDVDRLWGEEDLLDELSPVLTDGATRGAGNVLFFTSGTTAKTKAVVLTEQSLCASAYNGGALQPLSPDDILMCMLPLDHVFGFVCGVLWGLSCGACVALGRGPRHYFDDLSYFRPTALSAVPLLLGFLLQKDLLNPELKLVLIGAGDCPPELPAALKAQGRRVCFGYGLTETSSGVALSLGDDPYAMTVCPDDEITIAQDGEILIKNETCMMQGYYQNEKATAAVLNNGVLATGDLGYFDENGLLHVTGRKKEVLVLADGTKVFLPEYERDLRKALPDKDFAVIALDGFPALVVRGDEADRPAVEALTEPVMRALPLGRRVRQTIFVPDPLPRTATGKIKRWELQQKVGRQ
ncbi:MAG: AMP-binding protein [Clostridia bacterium]|nr:AMP-binding protein [Clostridia bacterium]